MPLIDVAHGARVGSMGTGVPSALTALPPPEERALPGGECGATKLCPAPAPLLSAHGAMVGPMGGASAAPNPAGGGAVPMTASKISGPPGPLKRRQMGVSCRFSVRLGETVAPVLRGETSAPLDRAGPGAWSVDAPGEVGLAASAVGAAVVGCLPARGSPPGGGPSCVPQRTAATGAGAARGGGGSMLPVSARFRKSADENVGVTTSVGDLASVEEKCNHGRV